MKKLYLFLCVLALLFSAAPVSAQGSLVYDQLSMQSVFLKRTMRYAVYLPPGYHFSRKNYPVLYLLHGAGENHTGWLSKGDLKRTMDQLITAKSIAPMIVVMPDAGMSYYMNSITGELPYESYFFQEFIPYIERIYRVAKGKKNRSVGGFSMGGYGALLYALRKPELFQTCLAFSSGIRTDEDLNALSESEYNSRYRLALGPHVPEQPHASEYYRKHYSILALVDSIPASQRKEVHFYIDCGDDDFLYRGNSLLHILMRDRKVQHEYRVRNGGHDWAYWKESLRNGLLYIRSVSR